MTAPRTLRAAFVVGALSLIILAAAPAPALAADHRELGGVKLQGQKAVGPNSATPPEGKVGTSQAIAPNYLLPKQNLPSASGLPTGKRQHKPFVMMSEPPSGASSKALHKIPTHNPPWSNPKLHGEGLPEPGMVHPPDPIDPASKVGDATPDPGIKPAEFNPASKVGSTTPDPGVMPGPQAAPGQGLATMGEPPKTSIRNEMLNNKYPENMKHE